MVKIIFVISKYYLSLCTLQERVIQRILRVVYREINNALFIKSRLWEIEDLVEHHILLGLFKIKNRVRKELISRTRTRSRIKLSYKPVWHWLIFSKRFIFQFVLSPVSQSVELDAHSKLLLFSYTVHHFSATILSWRRPPLWKSSLQHLPLQSRKSPLMWTAPLAPQGRRYGLNTHPRLCLLAEWELLFRSSPKTPSILVPHRETLVPLVLQAQRVKRLSAAAVWHLMCCFPLLVSSCEHAYFFRETVALKVPPDQLVPKGKKEILYDKLKMPWYKF